MTFQELKHQFLNGGGLISTFLRSIVSSQAASWIDLGSRMLFYSIIFVNMGEFYRSNLSVAIGAVMGGMVNCFINYKFTFHADGQSVRAVVIKYIMVWTGSLLLNMYGTTFLAMILSRWGWLHSIGFTNDAIFAASTLTVSLLVSWFWNFLLQRNFVYRPNRFDPVAQRICDIITLRRHRN